MSRSVLTHIAAAVGGALIAAALMWTGTPGPASSGPPPASADTDRAPRSVVDDRRADAPSDRRPRRPGATEERRSGRPSPPPAADVVRAAAAAEQTAELERLRAQVDALETALEDEQDIRAEREGEAFGFPEELPEQFTEEALRAAFAETFDAIGIDGEVESLDCSEFPCIVYGDAITDGETTMQAHFDALNASLRERYGGPEETGVHASVWSGEKIDDATGEKVRENRFAFAVYPQDLVPDDQKTAMQKRLNFRQSHSRKARAAAEGD